MINESQNIKRLIIKNSIINISDISIFIGAGILFYYISRLDFDFWFLLPIILLSLGLYRTIKKIIDRKPQIVLDENGINLIKRKEFYDWSKIKFAYINQNSSGGSFENNASLSIVLSNKEISVNLKNLKYSEKALINLFEFYLGKDKNKPKDKFKSEIFHIIKNKENLNEIMRLFSKHKSKQIWFGLPICFGVPGLSIYIQINSDFPYVFALGFVLTVLIMFIFIKSSYNRFKKLKPIHDLSKDEYDKISIKYEIKNENEEKRMKLGFVFLSILTIAIFVISYLVSR